MRKKIITQKISPKLEKLLESTELDVRKKRNISKPISSKAELKKHLDSLEIT